MQDKVICVPGQKLCKKDDQHVSGDGTYVRRGFIYASLLGYLNLNRKEDKIIVEILRTSKQNVVPNTGSIVTARVTNVNPRFCKCNIICIEDTVLSEPFRAIIRKEDVRATEKDKIEIYKSFRPGDIIQARVLSLGDAQSYILSTAEDELGVVDAQSEAGAAMIPVSWIEMQCPLTYNREFRKVAKVVPGNFNTTVDNINDNE